ncbi:hypothetical protein GGF31_004265 [Allomyces arbusculus]|nr:hypothetical protein GGF31_004265 [Allomyces arbusculus]
MAVPGGIDDLFGKLAIHAVTVVGKAAFGLAVKQAVGGLTAFAKQRLLVGSGNSGSGNVPAASTRAATHATLGALERRADGGDASSSTTGDTDTATDASAAEQQRLRAEFERLDTQRRQLEQKVAILTPSIDMIQVVCAKSNHVGLHAVLTMAQDLHRDLDTLSAFLATALGSDSVHSVSLAQVHAVSERVQAILAKIEDSVPYLNLAIAVSGVKLGGGTGSAGARAAAPASALSLSVLLNASALLQRAALAADEANDDSSTATVPMAFPCRVYRLFEASVRAEGRPNWTWKLEHLRSAVTVRWADPTVEGASGALVVMDRTGENDTLQWDLADLKRMLFTATGRLLNIPDSSPGAPVLVLHLDEYVALEILPPDEWDPTPSESESDDEDDESDSKNDDSSESNPVFRIPATPVGKPTATRRPTPPATTTDDDEPLPVSHQLSLLEAVLRLITVERALGTPHLAVPDDLLWVYLASDQMPDIGSVAVAAPVPLPPVYLSPAPASATAPSPAASRSRRSVGRSPAPAPAERDATPPPVLRRKSRPSRRGLEHLQQVERTPAPVRVTNLMNRFMHAAEATGSSGAAPVDGAGESSTEVSPTRPARRSRRSQRGVRSAEVDVGGEDDL